MTSTTITEPRVPLRARLRAWSSRRLDGAAGLVFWGWNGLFLLVTLVGLLPIHLASLLAAGLDGEVPLELALCTLALITLPVVASAAGLTSLRHRPRLLFGLFYGVEAPLFLVLLVRIFFLRELTIATGYVLVVASLAAVAFAVRIAEAHRADPWTRALAPSVRAGRFAAAPGTTPDSIASALLRLLAGVVCLAVGLWAGLLVAFWAVPAGAELAVAFFSFEWLGALGRGLLHAGLGAVLFFTLAVSLFFASGTLFVAMPIALVALYGRTFTEAFARSSARLGRVPAALVTAVTFTTLVVGFALATAQPQRAALSRLAAPPSTDAERRAIVRDAEALRAGLVNAYLAPYRYTSPGGRARDLARVWQQAFALDDTSALGVQRAFDTVARPIVYDSDDGSDDRTKAAALYADVFDASIQKAEKPAIVRALTSTYERSTREAGLLDEGGRRVHVARQEVTIREQGLAAEVELHEVYASASFDQEEVLYHLTLPASAVITGLWLGDTDDRSRAFAFTVSPRGAAQAVYRAEVSRRVDPALVEQVGPQQYRLRAFPVPPRVRGSDAPPPHLHLWLTYAVLQHDGAWPLPHLAERRSAFFDDDTALVIDGAPVEREDDDTWLPRSVPAKRVVAPAPFTVELAPGEHVRATPRADLSDGTGLSLGTGRRVAVVVDRGFSMNTHAAELERALAWLDAHVVPRVDVDLYLSTSKHRGEPAVRIDDPSRFDPRALVFFGATTPGGLVRDLRALAAGTRYDAVVVLTDGSSAELAEDGGDRRPLEAPLWLVHLGGVLPASYDDALGELVEKSGGGVDTELPRVFARIALAERTRGGLFADGYLFTVEPAGTGDPDEAGALGAIAARQRIRAALSTVDPTRLGALDHLHAMAKRHGIVTPYSSMIVLVEERQREALARAEAAADRFDREVEGGEEALTTPGLGGFGGALTATPEPEEWALFLLALAALAVAHLRKNGWLAVG